MGLLLAIILAALLFAPHFRYQDIGPQRVTFVGTGMTDLSDAQNIGLSTLACLQQSL